MIPNGQSAKACNTSRLPLVGGSMSKPRLVGCNYLLVDGLMFVNQVVEIYNDKVVRYFPLTEEQPNTEWFGGTIEIVGQKAWRIF